MDISTESQNYLRLGMLVVDIGEATVQDIFRSRYEILKKTPWTHIPRKANEFSKTKTKKGTVILNSLTDDQKNIINNKDVSFWDLTLLYIILENVEFTTDTEQVATHREENIHIKNLKDMRNKYAHSAKRRISQKDFNNWWKITEGALLFLKVAQETIREVKESGIVRNFQTFDLPTAHFTGRQDLLEEIHSKLNNCFEKETCEERMVVLRGLGGIGKSELARAYANNYIEDPIIQNVAWIDAEKLTSLEASFVSLAHTLKLSTESKNLDEIVQSVYDHFSKHVGRGLFIFDNSQQMNDKPFGIFKYLPKQYCERRPLILVTARDSQWDDIPKENILTVEQLSEKESVELLKQKFQLTPGQQNNCDYNHAIKLLAQELQGYPLGLALATSNIVNAEWTDLQKEIHDYIEYMRIPHPDGEWMRDEQIGAATKYDLIMENVWKATLDKINGFGGSGLNALNLLNLMAYLSTDNITVEKITGIYKYFKKPFKNKGLHILEKYSLVSIHRETFGEKMDLIRHRIRIHRLVQHYAREILHRQNDFSYLLGICNYLSHDGLLCEKDNFYKENETTIMGVHDYLKGQKWPQKSISYSIIFCSILATHDFDNGASRTAYIVAKSMHELLKNEICSEDIVQEDVKNLYFLCIFWTNNFGYLSEFQIHTSECYNSEKCKLEEILLALVQPSVENVMFPTPKLSYVREHSLRFCFHLLHRNFDRMPKLQQQLLEIVLATLNGCNLGDQSKGCNYKNISEIYKLLWNIGSHVTTSDFAILIAAAFRKHFEVYPTLEFWKNSGEKPKTYWKNGGPIQYNDINYRFDRAQNLDTTKAFLDSFFDNHGLQILVDHFSFLSQLEESSLVEYLKALNRQQFRFIQTAAFDWNFEGFLESEKFLYALYDLTRALCKLGDDCVEEQMICSMSWFALYAKCKENDSLQSKHFSIDTVSAELNVISKRAQKTLRDYHYRFHISREVLTAFLNGNKNTPNSLAVDAAQRYLGLTTPSETPLLLETNGEKEEIKAQIRTLKETSEESVKLLYFMSYFHPNDLNLYEPRIVEEIFKQSYGSSVPEGKGLCFLEESSLITINTLFFTSLRQIKIHEQVQSCTREMLDSENDYFYLLAVCKFLCSRGLEENRDVNEQTLRSLHNFLKEKAWPVSVSVSVSEQSISFSIIICNLLTRLNESYHAAIEVARDVLNQIYVEVKNIEDANSNKPTEFDELNCLLLCLFWISNKGICKDHFIWEDPRLCKENLENVFIKLCVEYLISPQSELSPLQEHSHTFCSMLVMDPRKFMESADPYIFKKLTVTIFETMNQSSRFYFDYHNIHQIFKLLWKYILCHNVKVSNKAQCLEGVLLLHSKLYNYQVSGVAEEEANEKVSDYWKDGGPLRYHDFIDLCDYYCKDKERELYLESFFINMGLQILVDHLVFVNRCGIGMASISLLLLVTKMAYNWESAQKFLIRSEFMQNLQQLTTEQLTSNDCLLGYKLVGLMTWFSLLARNEIRQEFTFSINQNQLAHDLHIMITQIEREGWDDFYSHHLDENVLATFLDAHKSESTSLVFRTAKRLLDFYRECYIPSDEEEVEVEEFNQ